ncbi:LysR family transcriptional regulator [Pelagibacterium lacus]|uniref:LysR family transcriptional regulator n=1 Tax=Pelagibacterium lacus TaxID=2282655 RepID=A0A369W4E5_9HYPH|nr:LysR family transcriptional regulator [Pelagibacterium lacus]RDE08132.1 LysR family transcriptional regulator [Pelagibacterium lacus]
MKSHSENTSINIRHFRAALALAEAQSFTKAADRIGVVPSALTETIRQLEEDVGLLLFDRQQRPVRPTQAGEDFLEAARRVVADFHGTLHDMRSLAGIEQGTVRVAAAPSVVRFHFAPLIADFRRLHPGVEIMVHAAVAERVGTLVLDREVDFGIAERWHDTDQLTHEPLQDDPFVLACHAGHPLAGRGKVELADIPADDIISLDGDTGIGKAIAQARHVPDSLKRGRLKAHDTIAQLTMVSQGLGVALVSRLAAAVIQSPDIRAVEVADLQLRRTICIITRARTAFPPAAERLISEARARISAY